MTEFFRSWTMNIVTAIIFVIFVEMMIMTDKFKKHVKLVTGLVLMVIIINPIVTLTNKKFSLDSLAIQNLNSLEQKDIQSQASQFDDIKNAQIVGVFKQKLTEQVRNQILSIEGIGDAEVYLVIDENLKSKIFGEIYEIEITSIKTKRRAAKEKSVEMVDIDIAKGEVLISEDMIRKIKEKLSNVYGIPNEKICVKIQMRGEG